MGTLAFHCTCHPSIRSVSCSPCAARSWCDCLTQSLLISQGLGLGTVPWVFTVQIYPRWHCSLAFEYVKVGEGSWSRSVQGRTLSHWPGSSLYCRQSMRQVQLGVQFLFCSSPFLCPHPLPCTPVTWLPGSHILLTQLLFSVSRVLIPVFFNLFSLFFKLKYVPAFLLTLSLSSFSSCIRCFILCLSLCLWLFSFSFFFTSTAVFLPVLT